MDPDGQYILPSAPDTGTGVQLWMSDRDGGSGVQLVKEPASAMTTGRRSGRTAGTSGLAQRTGNWQVQRDLPQYQLAVYDRETGERSVRSDRSGSAIRPTLPRDGGWSQHPVPDPDRAPVRHLRSGDERLAGLSGATGRPEAWASLDALPGMSFTPDSREVVASYSGKIWRIPVDGAAPQQIPFRVRPTSPWVPRWRSTIPFTIRSSSPSGRSGTRCRRRTAGNSRSRRSTGST